jgi:DNA topoisomerase-3
MENAGKEDMPDEMERKGIGTPATRADTIETLLKREYITRKDKQLRPTEKGINLVKVLPDHDSVKSPILTAEWEADLLRVERGEMSAEDFMGAVADYVRSTVRNNQTVPDDKKALVTQSPSASAQSTQRGKVLGKCPRCGGDIAESGKVYSCSNASCQFFLWRDSIFFKEKQKELTPALMTTLLKEGRVFMSGLYSKKTNKTYNATIILDASPPKGDKNPDGKAAFRMEFEKK